MSLISKKEIWKFTLDLYPIYRCLTGEGVRETLSYIKNQVGSLKIDYFKSGLKAYDWIIPNEWSITDAYIECEDVKIIDFKKNNLHVVGYSSAVNKILSYNQLIKKLHYLKDLPNAIPYRTNYYLEDWGFCISFNDFKKLRKNKKYKVVIQSKKFKGKLNYGECLIKGKSSKEIVFSTNICHPSMGNNETSGIVITLSLLKYLKSLDNYFSYRIIFIPETIGAIAYINKNLKKLKENVIAGYHIVCVGDNKEFSFLSSPNDDKYCDKVGQFALNDLGIEFKKYSYLDRGSDERQFCSPNIDLPWASLMRSKYGTYKEYHTSLDNLKFINKEGLHSTFKVYCHLINIIENNFVYKNKIYCEPFLLKHKLRGSLGGHIKNKFEKNKYKLNTKSIVDILSYLNNDVDLIDICRRINISFSEATNIIKILLEKKIIEKSKI